MNILVRAPNWIGDQILAYPFFHYLRKANPSATIVSVCVPWVKDIQFKGLVDEVVALPFPKEATWIDRMKTIEAEARSLRSKYRFDLAYSLPNSISAAWLLFRSGAKQRVGYRVEGRGLLLNRGLRWDASPTRHRAQAYVDLLPRESRIDDVVENFWTRPAEDPLDDPIKGECDSFSIEREWTAAPQIPVPDFKYWILAPGATADSRRWPIEYFMSLARKIYEETKRIGLVVGGPSERELARRLCSDDRLGLVDFVAKGPVSSLGSIFRSAAFTVSNESGLAHVAALCGSPVSIVCGAADPRRTTPTGPGPVIVTANPVECWPCEKNVCVQTESRYLQCLRGIEVERVWEDIQRVTRKAS